MKLNIPVKPADIAIILVALGITGFAAFKVYVRPQKTAGIVIQGQQQEWVFPLDAEETVRVKGPLGETVVRIHDRQAWVDSSPCDNQTCVAAGHVNSQGDWVACLPNNVFLMIEGNDGTSNAPDRTAW